MAFKATVENSLEQAYIEHEMRMRNYEKVEKLFQRCLIKEHIIIIVYAEMPPYFMQG